MTDEQERISVHASTMPWTKVTAVLKTENCIAIVVFSVLALIPLFGSGYVAYILPQYMMYGVLAMSLGLIWGFGGIVSFGQAAFFAIGGYAFGLAIGAEGIGEVANPAYIGLLLAVIIPGILAFITGYFLFSGGVRGAYFVILTLALSIIVEQLGISEAWLTGGWNGLFVPRPSLSLIGMDELSLNGNIAFYYTALPLAAGVYAILRWFVGSKVGKILKSIRENEDRTLALGYNPAFYKSITFGLSGAVAGIAGAGYAAHSGFIDPTTAGVLFSTQVIVWVAIAGRSSLLAAFLGGLIVTYLADWASALSPRFWQLALALIFVAVVAFLRGGIADFIQLKTESRVIRSEPGESK